MGRLDDMLNANGVLQPCPFCGSEAKRADCIGCGYVQVICPECGANITITIIRNQEDISKESMELIRRWNRRQ